MANLRSVRRSSQASWPARGRASP